LIHLLNRTLDRLVSALQFLTILPLGQTARFEPMGMIAFFPVVGVVLGTLVSAADLFFLQLWPKPVAALLDVILLAALTGALHLDGLGDTADGLFSHRSRQRVMEIMKDSRVGAMGMIAVVLMLLVKWAGLGALESHRHLAIILVPAYARAAMIFGIRCLDYGRPEGGTGLSLFQRPLENKDFLWVVIPVGLSLFMGWQGLWLNLVFALSTAVIIGFYRKQLGCITGDMLGAMTETLEAILFLSLALKVWS
jgi:adenosylcobinamide-GDP ribazoletransferase